MVKLIEFLVPYTFFLYIKSYVFELKLIESALGMKLNASPSPILTSQDKNSTRATRARRPRLGQTLSNTSVSSVNSI